MNAKCLNTKICRAFLKNRENCEISEAILRAKNAAEFKHRLQWLSEGSMMYHLSGFKTPTFNCEKEKALFQLMLAEVQKPAILA